MQLEMRALTALHKSELLDSEAPANVLVNLGLCYEALLPVERDGNKI